MSQTVNARDASIVYNIIARYGVHQPHVYVHQILAAGYVLTFEHVPPFRQGESVHVSGTQGGNGIQLVVCEQSEPHVPTEQMTRY